MTTYHYANGKRKTAVCRVRLHEKGTGKITINDKDISAWIKVAVQQEKILSPLELTGMMGKFDVTVKIEGSGQNAQAEAIRNGIAKALTVFDPSLRVTLKKVGFLTRDARVKERKKFGLKRARRGPQFSKR